MVVAALDKFVADAVRKIVLDIVANLTASPSQGGTPVDTGWARANWIVQIGSPHTSTFGDPTSVSTAAQEAGKAAVIRYKLGQGPVFISNNVPYILRLNEGWSQQAPAGFVQGAIAKAVRQDFLGGLA